MTDSKEEMYRTKTLLGLAVLEATVKNDISTLTSMMEEFSRDEITAGLVAAGFCLATNQADFSLEQVVAKLQQTRQRIISVG